MNRNEYLQQAIQRLEQMATQRREENLQKLKEILQNEPTKLSTLFLQCNPTNTNTTINGENNNLEIKYSLLAPPEIKCFVILLKILFLLNFKKEFENIPLIDSFNFLEMLISIHSILSNYNQENKNEIYLVFPILEKYFNEMLFPELSERNANLDKEKEEYNVKKIDIASTPYPSLQLGFTKNSDNKRSSLKKRFNKNLEKYFKIKNSFSKKKNKNPFELFPISNLKNTKIEKEAKVDYKFIGTDFGGQYVNGHLIILQNPINHFSILEAYTEESKKDKNVKKGGCFYNVTNVVPISSKNNIEGHFCKYATNAGFFNTHTHSCLGNIISDNRIVHTSERHNVNFGILKNGTYFTGYLDPTIEKIKLEDFSQLISGVIWLVKNGENFVSESALLEDMTTQETGNSFINVRASRTAIGHDKYGNLMILNFDGDGNHNKGPNLHELADFLIENFGIQNAINLDGGGSATIVKDQEIVINAVSDGCNPSNNGNDYDNDFGNRNSIFRCLRKVSTITCIHDDLTEKEKELLKMVNEELAIGKLGQLILFIEIFIIIFIFIGISIILLLLIFICMLCCGTNNNGSTNNTKNRHSKYSKLKTQENEEDDEETNDNGMIVELKEVTNNEREENEISSNLQKSLQNEIVESLQKEEGKEMTNKENINENVTIEITKIETI
ncbi:hypothetical protein ABK040_016636 [Willaertia magna]